MRNIAILATVFFSFSTATQSSAQESELDKEQIQKLYETSRIVINGRETPNLIPDHIRFDLFFSRYGRLNHPYRKILKQTLSPRDDKILLEHSQRHANIKIREEGNYETSYLAILASGQSMSPLELANAIEVNTQQLEATQTARFRAVVNRLSSQGQVIVKKFAYDRVRPSFSRESPVLTATLAPEYFKEQTLLLYEAHRSGELDRLERRIQEGHANQNGHQIRDGGKTQQGANDNSNGATARIGTTVSSNKPRQ